MFNTKTNINTGLKRGDKMKCDLWQEQREKAKVTQSGLKVLCYSTSIRQEAKPALRIWKPKANKPYVSYYYLTVKDRAEAIKKAIDSFNTHKLSIKKYKEDRKPNLEVVNSLKKGDLFYTSWGYDQTNYDYITVLEVSKTKKTVKCQRTKSLHMGESGVCNVQEPVFCPFGEIFTMQVRSGYQGGVSLVGTYPFLHDGSWSNGTKGFGRRDSFAKATTRQQFHETMLGYGH